MKLETLTSGWRGAVLLIFRQGTPRPLRRSAVFLFDLPGGGFAWIEPSYRDDLGPASPAQHNRPKARLSPISSANPNVGVFYDDDETGESGMVYPWRPEDYPPVPELEAFHEAAERDGLDLKAERDRVRPAVSVRPEA